MVPRTLCDCIQGKACVSDMRHDVIFNDPRMLCDCGGNHVAATYGANTWFYIEK